MKAFRIAGIIGFLAVALGASGAHMLQPILLQHGTVEVWRTGSLYHLVHAVVLLALAAGLSLRGENDSPNAAFWLFLAGTVLFSGSLYLFALTQTVSFMYITPFGGVILMAGWVMIAVKGLK